MAGREVPVAAVRRNRADLQWHWTSGHNCGCAARRLPAVADLFRVARAFHCRGSAPARKLGSVRGYRASGRG